MVTWILLAYFKMGNSGGPLAAEFYTHEACKQAIEAMEIADGWALEWAVCVPTGANPA